MTARKRIILAVLIFLLVLIIGISGYMIIEDYSFIEGLYMSIITIATVGFGEVKPLSDAGRCFTAFLIIIGFISLAFAGRAIIESFFERIWSVSFKIRNMKKKIAELKDHYIVCGFGRVGSAAVDHFIETGVDFVIIEPDNEKCIELQKKDFKFIEGDATRENILLEAKIKTSKGLIALLNNDPDNLFLVLTARELNPTLKIISRAEDISSESKIIRAGADKVITPYVSTGKQIADTVLGGTGISFGLTEPTATSEITPQWITIKSGSGMLEKRIAEVSNEMNREVFGLRRIGRDFIFPDPDIKLKVDDMLLVIDDKIIEENKLGEETKKLKKLVIVDDNPIILHLYARLFFKNGFLPVTAVNGKEGLDLIRQEKPVAAVIDFMLPVLSGIELCSQIRKEEEYKNIKLILFTGDEEEETRKRALEAGADEVIIKSPNAHEIIETVVNILKKE